MKKHISYRKMHGLGNDFMVIYDANLSLNPAILPISQWSNRRTGIGFDQLLFVTKHSEADFSCQIYNADGSEAEQCGNGMRCIGRFLVEEKLINEPFVRIRTLSGMIPIRIYDYDHIEVNMGSPSVTTELVSLHMDCYGDINLLTLSLGNPHAIIEVNSIYTTALTQLASEIASHKIFPNGVNVGFMEIINSKYIRLRTFERGSGETLACGSNACAAVIAGIVQQKLESKVRVELALGHLDISWDGMNHPVMMVGPAASVFRGVIEWAFDPATSAG